MARMQRRVLFLLLWHYYAGHLSLSLCPGSLNYFLVCFNIIATAGVDSATFKAIAPLNPANSAQSPVCAQAKRPVCAPFYDHLLVRPNKIEDAPFIPLM